MSNNYFYNPYHFVPVKSQLNYCISKDNLKNDKNSHLTHNCYINENDVYSGRIVCRITTEDPIFIGNERIELQDKSHRVSHFELNGKPAIPASTIRGMISSLAEAASNSALRVLEEKKYICRIGRKRVEKKDSYKYFRQISTKLLPFNPERKKITIAEQIFGFVENIIEDEKENEDKEEKDLLSFASRLKFSFGILGENEKEPYQSDEVLLKILDSPKPPCPSFYFKPKCNTQGSNFIAKTEFSLEKHIPQGRKFYLHRYYNDKEPWKTKYENENLSQKSRIKPLKKGLKFYFHIDFDNLTRRELSLLCYALKPSESYRHKIGMGKSIGLGKINIDPVGIFIIDRVKRYNKDDVFSSDRYHKSWVDNSVINELPDIYSKEKRAVDLGGMASFEELRNEFSNSMDADIKKAIELIGDPNNVKHPVHTPQVAEKDIEQETFRWFVENEKGGTQREGEGQGLIPLNRHSKALPTLERRIPIDEKRH